MKKLFLVLVIFVSSFFTSCTEEIEQEPKKPKIEKVKACCGEVGTIPDEPED